MTGPLGLAADPNGNIYVADTGNNRVVEEMYLSGVTYDVPAGYALQLVVASGLSGPQAVAADANGDVYIADTGNNRDRWKLPPLAAPLCRACCSIVDSMLLPALPRILLATSLSPTPVTSAF